MPRKTLALLVGLVLVTVILFIVALQTGKNQPLKTEDANMQAAPAEEIVHTVLSLSPELVEISSGRQGSVDVLMDPSGNEVTGIQLELLYDPTMVSNVKVVPGPAFPNPNVLIDNNNPQTGRYTYAYGVRPNQPTLTKQGVIAKITFTARGTAGRQSQFILHPTTIVTAVGIDSNVLKEATGATVVIVAPTGTQTRQAAPAATTPAVTTPTAQ